MIKPTIVLACLLLFLGCKAQSNSNDTATIRSMASAKDKKSQLQVIKLSGTPFEIGFQHGEILKSEIHDLVSLWESDIESNFKMPADEFIAKFLKYSDYMGAIKKWTPDLLAEIKGISKGANIEFDKMFVFQLIDEMWTNYELIQTPHHCTSLAIGKRTVGDSVNYIAQNIDVPFFYHKYKILLEIEGEASNNKKLITTFPGYIGANGLNNNIGININSLMDLESSLDGLPVCFVVRGVLNQKSFKDAAQFIRKIKHASGQNYTIGSKNNIASFECSASKVAIYWPDSSKLYTYHANDALANNNYHPFNKVNTKERPRFTSMQTRILNPKNTTKETIVEALQSKDNENDPICRPWTWVSTIIEFHDNYNVLLISPGKPDATDYEKFIIQ